MSMNFFIHPQFRSRGCVRACAITTILVLCGTSLPSAAQTIAIPKPVPYAADGDIAGNIKRECQLGDQLADFISDYAKRRNIVVSFVAETNSTMPGRVLVLEIGNADSSGNAFLGHHKSTLVHGQYFQDSKLIGNFKDRRDSMGGLFSGFKGSCSVLGRTIKAIGSDIAEWMVNPVMDADLGDLK